MANERAKELLKEFEPLVVKNIEEWRGRYSNSRRPFPDGPPWPADSPCYYCEGGDLCEICIHNDKALIWRLAD